jgi:hypothetical protein
VSEAALTEAMDQPTGPAAIEAGRPLPAAGSLARLVFVFLLCVYLVTNRGSVWSSDAALRIGLTEHLVSYGKLGYPPDCLRWLQVDQGRMMWGPGHPFLLIPSVLAGRLAVVATHPSDPLKAAKLQQLVRELGATVTNALLAAFTSALLLMTGAVLGHSLRVCLLASLAFGLGCIWWPYSQDAFYEVLQGTCLLAAFYYALRYVRRPSVGTAVLCSTALGYELITKLPNASMLLAIVAYWLVWRATHKTERPLREGRALIAFALILIAFGLVQVWADWSWSGKLFASQLSKDPDFQLALQQGSMFSGALHALFGLDCGLLWYSPLLVVGLLWLPALARRDRALAVAFVITLLLGLAIVGKTILIQGRSWGPRYFAEVFPILALTLFPWIDSALQPQRHALRRFTVAFLGLAVALQLLATTVHMERFWDDSRRMGEIAASRFPNNFPLARRPAELAQVLHSMASHEAWGLAAESRDARSAEHLADRARPLNVLNYWWSLAYYQRVPWPALALVVLLLLSVGGVCLRSALHQVRDCT